MNEYQQNYNNQEQPSPNHYQTGTSRPRKSRSGLVAVLLALVIVFGGIISALSLLNIHLLSLLFKEKEPPSSVEFSQQASLPTEETTEATQPQSLDTPAAIHLEEIPDNVENVPQAGGLSLQHIYEENIHSVVSIACNTGTGTGVVFSADGFIVTNAHVVANASSIEVLFADDRRLPAQLVGKDTVSDLAVLQVDAQQLQPAQFGDSESVRVGDSVVAIGDPLGLTLRGTMTDGIISAINRDISVGGRTMTLLQTNTALNNGNSGGPLLNCHGQVIGINTVKIGDNMNSTGVEGLGFAIPSATVKEVVDQLVEQGYVSGRPSLGFTGEDLTPFDMLYYRLPQGVYITGVSPAAQTAGIAPGDILLQLNGIRVQCLADVQTVLYSLKAGETVELELYRSGQQFTALLELEEAK